MGWEPPRDARVVVLPIAGDGAGDGATGRVSDGARDGATAGPAAGPTDRPGDVAGGGSPTARARADWSAALQVSPDRILVLPQVDEETPAAQVARLCLAISAAIPAPGASVVLAATGASASMLPSVGFAQRAAHRQVQAYVMALESVDEIPAAGTIEWPDAPVWIRTDDDHVRSAAELRGWRLLG